MFHNSNVFGSCIIHILYIYSTNIGTGYFKHGIYSPIFSLQDAVCFIILTYLVLVSFTFCIQCVLKLKKSFRRQKFKHKWSHTTTALIRLHSAVRQNCAQGRIGLLPTAEHSRTFNDYHNALRSLVFSKDQKHTHSLLASGCWRKKGWSPFVIFCLPFRLLLLVRSKHSFQPFPDRGDTCDTARHV